uniref:Uncharacterized protein n=1 Tax=Avena sativa TaxID=4498 RepID=A0ACD5Y6A8_AVESA
MDEEVLPQGHWSLQLKIGEELTLVLGDNEALWVTDVFLVDPESADSRQGVVAACVDTGTKNIMLAGLSSEVTDVELLDPAVLDKEFCFYVVRPAGNSDSGSDTTDADVVIVQFVGFMLHMLSPDTDDEEVQRQGEVEPDVARTSSTQDVLHIAA